VERKTQVVVKNLEVHIETPGGRISPFFLQGQLGREF
jgi:hypothetical protein